MPGLLGISTIATPRIGSRVEAARERMLRHPRVTMDLVATTDQTHWLGHARLDGAPRTIVDGGQQPSAVLHGVLHNEAALRKEFGGPALVEATGDLIATMYAREGARFVERLEGEFVVAVIDPARHVSFVATDPVGNYPIYWHADQQDFVFSSDLSAVLGAVPSRNRLNLMAVADYLTIGAVLEDKTLVDGVSLLAPGTSLEFDLARGEVRQHQYLDIASFFGAKASDKSSYLDAVVNALERAVGRALDDARPVGLSLSGGLDTRAILAAVDERRTGLLTYTLGVAGCAEQAIAKQLAGIAHTKHTFFELEGNYLRDFLPNITAMVSATDGLYLTHGLTETLALRLMGDAGIAVLLRGHGGELAKTHLAWPLQTDGRVHASASLDELASYLAARANFITPDLALDRVLAPWAVAKAGDGAVGAFRRVLAGSNLTPAEACSYLMLHELHRRVTVPSLELFRTRVEVRLPFLDVAFLRTLLGAPADWRDTTEIHQRIIRKGLPELLKVRTSKTGAPVDANPTTERILDKVNGALRAFNVHGYRRQHNFDEWMRISLLDTVQAELTGEWARTRNLVSRETIKAFVASTASGKANRSYLLLTLLIIELWMRENRIEAS